MKQDPQNPSTAKRPGPRLILRAALAFAGLTACALPAHAYLDPGTGSIILQSLLAGIAVAIGVVRLYWHRFKAFLGGLSGSGTEQDAEARPEQTRDSET